jgi:hypothetical protein
MRHITIITRSVGSSLSLLLALACAESGDDGAQTTEVGASSSATTGSSSTTMSGGSTVGSTGPGGTMGEPDRPADDSSAGGASQAEGARPTSGAGGSGGSTGDTANTGSGGAGGGAPTQAASGAGGSGGAGTDDTGADASGGAGGDTSGEPTDGEGAGDDTSGELTDGGAGGSEMGADMGSADAAAEDVATDDMPESPLPPIDDYSAEGPFATTVEQNAGPGGNYTIFRPDPLGQDGFLHAPIVFGPGIGQSVMVHTEMLSNFASHGFVVVGCNLLSGGPGDAGNRQTMLDGLAWIVEQNSTAGIYEGKLAVTKAVSMGFSVGGTSAVEIGGEDAVATVVSIHGHTASAALHGPMLQTTGTQDTVGMPLQQSTYDMSEVPTFLATLTGAPHQYIESDGGGEERPAIVAWMRYWIYGDTGGEHYFFGDDCVLCMPPWENPQRKNWQ